ncbi:non-canonical purine NTP pyrophosphatase [Halococcus saccharolyticus]|uniref:Ham1 protein / nucleoside-triphosphatase n=1 Tax=Halococcus saccharolyticus DSM 5350 TaxID=1227455 RepID=M0MD66_9EURY|nr:non-canonical purine NTP pyrophosphatase [Halococcus saccharolyticus]EMA43712.1 Ham1 protein / nucleoside-triphosphatase [Halococcus saccharolyticus DSM 5350]
MLRYVTTNEGKVAEAREYLDDVSALDFDYTEIQSDSLVDIAARGAREAHAHADEPVIVDDAGLFVDSLGGFPGPYSAYVEDTVGIEAVGRLAERERGNEEDGRAAFRCVIAYCDGEEFAASPDPVDRGDRVTAAATDLDEDEESGDEDADDGSSPSGPPVKLFEGVVRGRIVEPRGDGGFGYDPIFEHDGTTMAEMSTVEKNAISHRGRALAKFGEWYHER